MNADTVMPCGLRAERRAAIGQRPTVFGRHRLPAGNQSTHPSGERSA